MGFVHTNKKKSIVFFCFVLFLHWLYLKLLYMLLWSQIFMIPKHVLAFLSEIWD